MKPISGISNFFTSRINPLERTLEKNSSLSKNENYISNFISEEETNFPFPDSVIADIFKIDNSEVAGFLQGIFNIQDSFTQFSMSYIKGEARPNNDLKKYLQFPSEEIKNLANKITDENDSNDEKMYKIEQWVIDNISYEYDIKNYGQEEYFATPSETLKIMSGDCDDFAFLIHSLGLNAGVDENRLRTYGGLVVYQNENGNVESGGHAWTSYKTEADNEWIILDGTFFTTDKPFSDRIKMSDDDKYFDDYFFVNLQNTVDTPYSNAIRNPERHKNYDNFAIGNIVNIKV